jgi:AraC-like DNA-binding protein
MISFAEIDLMSRGATIALLLMWSLLLWRDHSRALAARIAIAMNVTIICHVLGTLGPPSPNATVLDILLDTASSAVIGLFWLFAKTWFDDAQRVSWRNWAIFAAPTLVVLVIDTIHLDERTFVMTIWFPILRSIWFAFALSGLWIVWRGRLDDLVEARRKLRTQLLVVVGGLCLLINIIEIAVFAFGAPSGLRSLGEIGIMLATVTLCVTMFGMRQADLFEPVKSAVPIQPAPTEEHDALKQRLLTHMQTQMPHRDETLTIAGLAAQLGEQEYRLRRFINGVLGYRNFAQFLNSFRLAEVKFALVDPSQKDVPILTIALDAGFGSLGPFNRAFREAEGMTPSAYRARTP